MSAHPLSLIAAFFLLVATALRAALAPEAQAAMDRGILAAKRKDYQLAARLFQDARKLAPHAPELYFNLGLAESRIPGRELRAISWFGAYLAASPAAANAAAIRQQIAALETMSRKNTAHLVKLAHEAALRIPDDTEAPTMGRDRGNILSEVASLWAGIGDVVHAQEIAAIIARTNTSQIWKDSAYKSVARAQIRAGKLSEAGKTVGLIREESDRNDLQKQIAEAAGTPAPTQNHSVYSIEDQWLSILGVGPAGFLGQLNTPMFLDLAGYLSSLPPTNDKYASYWALNETAGKFVRAQIAVDELAKLSAQRPAGK